MPRSTPPAGRFRTVNPPDPEAIATDIAQHLRTALEQFETIAKD